MSTGVVKFRLGGIDRQCKVAIDLAPRIEEAAGKGIIPLFRELLRSEARLVHVAEIVRLALDYNGVSMTLMEVLQAMQKDGLRAGYTAAGLIVGEFFNTGEEDTGKKA